MAFVFNFGYTLAVSSYSFLGKSKANSARTESYTEYATVTSTSGEYAFAFGSVNNKLSINYGVSTNYDLMVKFTASYTNSSHKASDFDLNFVERDKWSIDLPTTTTLSSTTSQTVYNLSSNSNSVSGTMYYLGTISGNGTIDLISGVTFYNNGIQSGDFSGDVLTVTFTSYYVKSNTDNYKLSTETPTHTFYTNSLSGTDYLAYNNWVKYMKSSTEYVDEASYMIYNAYSNDTYAISCPSDFAWTEDFDLASQTEPTYSNTAYRYTITKTSTGNVRVLEGAIAGNKYRGGLGVFVFPSQRSKVKISLSAFWEKDGVIQGTMPNNAIQHLGYSSELDSEGYSDDITKPTYINVLEYIMITAEGGFREALINGCKLVITDITVSIQNSSSDTEHANLSYEINNPTEGTPILARYKDIAGATATKPVKVSVGNHSGSAMKINSFTISGKLWYAGYTELSSGETSFQVYQEQVKGYLGVDNIIYDTNLWSASKSGDTITFTAKNNSFSNYVTAGYEMPLISGVIIPNQSADLAQLTEIDNKIYVYDLWCSLAVTITSYSEVTTYSTSGENTGVEVVTTAYDSMTASNGYAYIYLRNNTNQNITSVSLTGLTLAQVTSSTNPRSNMNASASFNYELMAFGGNPQYVSSTGSLSTSAPSASPSSSTAVSVSGIGVNIKPNDCVLMFRIKPSQNAVVYSYSISAQMSSGQSNLTAHLLTDKTGVDLINNSSNKYEFRVKSNSSLSSYLSNSTEFVLDENGTIAYYIGVINENQIIKIANALQGNLALEVELIEHIDGADASQYTASNYSAWAPPTQWLTSMQNIYKLLDASSLGNV